MLIEFSCKNHRSFKERQTLSMVKSRGLNSVKDKALEASNTFVPDAPSSMPLLRTAAIYGANASGKSNLIKAMETMRKIVLLDSQSVGDTFPVEPFLFDSDMAKEPSEFEVIFIAENVRYQYGFAVTAERVIEEWLYSFPKGRERHLLGRFYDEEDGSYQWHINNALSGKKTIWRVTTRPNELLLSNAVRLNSKELEPILNWIRKDLNIIGLYPCVSQYEAEQRTAELFYWSNVKDLILVILKSIEPNLVNIKVIDNLNSTLNINKKHIFFIYSTNRNTFQEISLDEVSLGTRKVFSIAYQWILAISMNSILVVDEINNHLHPLLVKFLVKLFNNVNGEDSGQLIFSTHETSILKNDIFRRDQIWFTEKNKDQASILYPLTDFKARDRDNLERDYLDGRYGALPYLEEISLNMEQSENG